MQWKCLFDVVGVVHRRNKNVRVLSPFERRDQQMSLWVSMLFLERFVVWKPISTTTGEIDSRSSFLFFSFLFCSFSSHRRWWLCLLFSGDYVGVSSYLIDEVAMTKLRISHWHGFCSAQRCCNHWKIRLHPRGSQTNTISDENRDWRADENPFFSIFRRPSRLPVLLIFAFRFFFFFFFSSRSSFPLAIVSEDWKRER